MDLFFEIRRHKTHIFCDAKETTNILELKRIVQGILKVKPEDQQLWKDDKQLQAEQTLADCGFNANTARAQQPAIISLALRDSDGSFEKLVVEPLSEPPPLPDVMRGAQGDATGTSQEQTIWTILKLLTAEISFVSLYFDILLI